MYHKNNETIRKRRDKMVIKVIPKCLGNDLLMKRKLNMPQVKDVAGDK